MAPLFFYFLTKYWRCLFDIHKTSFACYYNVLNDFVWLPSLYLSTSWQTKPNKVYFCFFLLQITKIIVIKSVFLEALDFLIIYFLRNQLVRAGIGYSLYHNFPLLYISYLPLETSLSTLCLSHLPRLLISYTRKA